MCDLACGMGFSHCNCNEFCSVELDRRETASMCDDELILHCWHGFRALLGELWFSN